MCIGNGVRVAIAICSLSMPGAAVAENLIYRPVIPAFGGNPNNFDYLIGLAQIQNKFTIPQSGGGGVPDISFPPIVIDLGGVGGDTPPVVPPTTLPTQ